MIKLDANGNILWNKDISYTEVPGHDGPSNLDFDPDEENPGVYVISSGGHFNPFGLYKFDADGNPLWSVLNSSDPTYNFCSVAVNPTDGSVCVNGYLEGVHKFGSNGNPLWYTYLANSHNSYGAYSIAVDPTDGSTVAISRFTGLVAKLDAAGTILWSISTARDNVSVAIDPGANAVYVVGSGYLHRLDLTNGNLIWERFVCVDWYVGLTVDYSDGSVYAGCLDHVLSKIDPADGSTLWTRDIGHIAMAMAIAYRTCVEAWVGDVTQTESREIRVPVEISGASSRGVYSAEATVTYDPTIISPTGYDVTGTLLDGQGWSIAWNELAPGMAKISMAGVSDLGGDGTLVFLTFERTDGAACRGCTDLGLEIMFNEGEPCAEAAGGSYCLPPETVAGTVRYYGCPDLENSNPPIPGVDLIACPHPLPPDCPVQVGATDSLGEYMFEVCLDTCYVVRPHKERLLETPAISAYDASLALRYTVSLESLAVCLIEPMLMADGSWCPEEAVYSQRVAADVSGNGAISAYDASMILKYAVGILEGHCGEWDFYCDRREYCPVDDTYEDQDYVGVLMGDVSGNWGGGGGGGGYVVSPPVSGNLTVGDVTGEPGGLVTVPLYLDTSWRMLSVQLRLLHDPGLLTVEAVRACGLASACQMAWNGLDGETRIGLAGMSYISGSGQILEVTYR
ncbi:MAG: PQQ-binding-like beta-propeller repeat protein, partial [bacterium]